MTEGKAGLRLDLRVKIVSADTCKVMQNAAVEIWHCDALGKYSGIASEGTSGKTFLRGIQRTNANGVAVFRTIYPGWYQGRALHIHLKAFTGGRVSGSRFIGGNEQHTGQLFFKESVTDRVAELLALQPARRHAHAHEPGHHLPVPGWLAGAPDRAARRRASARG